MSKPKRPPRIALVGDHRPDVVAHVCIPRALMLSARALDIVVLPTWVETTSLDDPSVVQFVESADGVWCVPASPYAYQAGVLDVIRQRRENNGPFLGTCGGFQHAVIEFARNVLGLADANSVEDDIDTPIPLITLLECPLRGVSAEIAITARSRLASIYNAESIEETYNCGFGFNPAFGTTFADSAMTISARAEEPKAVEISTHSFFIGTAFQPERSAQTDTVHPLVTAFVQASATHASTRTG